MIEVVRGIVGHTEALHHGSRSDVARYGPGKDFLETQLLEAEAEGCPGGLCGVAMPPRVPLEAPSDLDRRREMRLPRWRRQPGEPEEGAILCALDRPESVPVDGPVLDDSIHQRVTLGTAEQRRKVLHDGWVGVHLGERLPVVVTPFAQHESVGSNPRDACYGNMLRIASRTRPKTPSAGADS